MRQRLLFVCFLFLLVFARGAWAADITFLVQNSQPKYLVGEPGTKGLCGDIYQALGRSLAKQNISTEFAESFLPIKRIFSQVETVPGHVFCGASRNEHREKRFRYAQTPLYRVHNVLVARADDPAEPLSIEELKAQGETIGALYGTASTAYLKQALGRQVNDSFDNLQEPLKLVGTPPYRLRFFFYHDLGMNYLVKRLPYPLKVIKTRFRSFQQWLIYSPETPLYVAQALEAGLREIEQSGELDRIVSQYLY